MELVVAFSKIPDPRQEWLVKHPLASVLMVAMLATAANADDYEAMQAFAEERLEWLQTVVDLPNGAPSADTFRRVFKRLDPLALERALSA